jgi:hypothetical protein
VPALEKTLFAKSQQQPVQQRKGAHLHLLRRKLLRVRCCIHCKVRKNCRLEMHIAQLGQSLWSNINNNRHTCASQRAVVSTLVSTPNSNAKPSNVN